MNNNLNLAQILNVLASAAGSHPGSNPANPVLSNNSHSSDHPNALYNQFALLHPSNAVPFRSHSFPTNVPFQNTDLSPINWMNTMNHVHPQTAVPQNNPKVQYVPIILQQPTQQTQPQTCTSNNTSNAQELTGTVASRIGKVEEQLSGILDVLNQSTKQNCKRNKLKSESDVPCEDPPDLNDTDDMLIDDLPPLKTKNMRKTKKKKTHTIDKAFCERVLWTAIDIQSASSIAIGKILKVDAEDVLKTLKKLNRVGYVTKHSKGYGLNTRLKSHSLDTHQSFITKLTAKYGSFQWEESMPDIDVFTDETDSDENEGWKRRKGRLIKTKPPRKKRRKREKNSKKNNKEENSNDEDSGEDDEDSSSDYTQPALKKRRICNVTHGVDPALFAFIQNHNIKNVQDLSNAIQQAKEKGDKQAPDDEPKEKNGNNIPKEGKKQNNPQQKEIDKEKEKDKKEKENKQNEKDNKQNGKAIAQMIKK